MSPDTHSLSGLIEALNFTDQDGHEVMCDSRGYLRLRLKRSFVRKIGRIDFYHGRLCYLKDVTRRKHLFTSIPGGAWGINGAIAKVLAEFEAKIVFNTYQLSYQIDAVRIFDIVRIQELAGVGWKWFKRQGFERQVLIGLNYWLRIDA